MEDGWPQSGVGAEICGLIMECALICFIFTMPRSKVEACVRACVCDYISYRIFLWRSCFVDCFIILMCARSGGFRLFGCSGGTCHRCRRPDTVCNQLGRRSTAAGIGKTVRFLLHGLSLIVRFYLLGGWYSCGCVSHPWTQAINKANESLGGGEC